MFCIFFKIQDGGEEKKKKIGETQWHFDQQQKLRDSVKTSGINCKEFKSAEDGCAMIKEVGMSRGGGGAPCDGGEVSRCLG